MEKYPHKDIGDRLERLRDKERLSQAAFAGKIGIKQQQYNRYETGKIKPPFKVLLRIAENCNITTDWILTGKQTDMPKVFAELMGDLKERMRLYRESGAIPKAAISNEEMAIIKCLRLLSEKDSLTVLKDITKKVEDDPLIPNSNYEKKQLDIVKMILKEKRFFRQGVDHEGLLLGYELLEESLRKKKPANK